MIRLRDNLTKAKKMDALFEYAHDSLSIDWVYGDGSSDESESVHADSDSDGDDSNSTIGSFDYVVVSDEGEESDDDGHDAQPSDDGRETHAKTETERAQTMEQALLGLPSKELEALLTRIVHCADILCTTPSLSNRDVCKAWRTQHARAIAVDEAANMSRPDLYTLWGNTLLPCVVGGDDQQLQPTVLTVREQRPQGTFLNRHVDDGLVSPLQSLKQRGWPVFRLHWQFRMARGLFDLCHQLAYPDLPFQYAPWCHIMRDEHRAGRDIESYLLARFPTLRPAANPSDHAGEQRLLPVFLNCRGTVTETDPVTRSKLNKAQVKTALDLLVDLARTRSIDPARMALVTPYRANVREIRRLRLRKEYTILKAMTPASSVDAFQGQERDVVVAVMGTTGKSGAGFTNDKCRLNVMYSRQRSALIIVGDMDAARARRHGAFIGRSILSNGGRDGALEGELGATYTYLVQHGRAVEA